MTKVIANTGKTARRVSRQLAKLRKGKDTRLLWAFYNASIDNSRVTFKHAREAVRSSTTTG